MKALLLASAALTLSLPVQADTIWLIMKESVRVGPDEFALGMEKLEMKDMEQCEEQGAVFMTSERLGIKREKYSGFECLEGK